MRAVIKLKRTLTRVEIVNLPSIVELTRYAKDRARTIKDGEFDNYANGVTMEVDGQTLDLDVD